MFQLALRACGQAHGTSLRWHRRRHTPPLPTDPCSRLAFLTSPDAPTDHTGQFDGALVQAGGQRESLHCIAEGNVDIWVTKRQRAAGTIVSECPRRSKGPTRRARYLEEHSKSNRQPSAHLRSGHLYLGHLPDRVIGQHARTIVHFVPERGIESSQTTATGQRAGCRGTTNRALRSNELDSRFGPGADRRCGPTQAATHVRRRVPRRAASRPSAERTCRSQCPCR
jgi:hypothetical protein